MIMVSGWALRLVIANGKKLLILDTDEFNHGGCRGGITSIRYHTMQCLIVSYLRNGIKNDESKWNYNER